MSPEHQFYVESLTKTFTATVVLQLAEEWRLGGRGLEATLSELQVFPPEVLDQLHRIGGVSYGSGITVSQLVGHRTGMKNFTYEDAGGPDSATVWASPGTPSWACWSPIPRGAMPGSSNALDAICPRGPM